MATNHTPTAGAALGNELRAGTVAKVGSTKRIQELNGMLHSNRPNVDITRARAYTKVYRETEGMPQHDAAVQGFGRGLPFPQRQRV